MQKPVSGRADQLGGTTPPREPYTADAMSTASTSWATLNATLNGRFLASTCANPSVDAVIKAPQVPPNTSADPRYTMNAIDPAAVPTASLCSASWSNSPRARNAVTPQSGLCGPAGKAMPSRANEVISDGMSGSS